VERATDAIAFGEWAAPQRQPSRDRSLSPADTALERKGREGR